MRNILTLGSIRLVAFVLLVTVAFNLPVWAQNPELQQRLAEVKQAMGTEQAGACAIYLDRAGHHQFER